jgi:hypothetical protein
MWTAMIARFGLPATLGEILEIYDPPLLERLRQPRPPLPGAGDLLLDLGAEATKPDPAPYVLAAQMLGFEPSACIAVEDSVNGLTSALRSGACVVQVRATETSAAPVAGVALVIGSLREFPREWVGSR